jgi:excinuclease ABC subunit A
MNPSISIRNARLHNLKNISLDIPKNQLVVLTGLSGSGKSTLAFDLLHKEGMRQYIESLGEVTHGLARPPVDSIVGLSPTISVDQHLTNHSPRSTVGTTTEIFTYLRVLYARLGQRPCPACGKNVPPPTYDLDDDWQDESDESPDDTYPCPHCGAPVPELGMANFSFNKPAGACPTCTGLGEVRQVILSRLVDESKSITENAITGWIDFHLSYYSQILRAAGAYYGFPFDPEQPIGEYSPIQRDLLLYGTESLQFQRHFPGVRPPTTNSQGRFEGVVTNLQRRYDEHAENAAYREKLEHLFTTQPCPDCAGTRLRPESRAVTVAGESLVDIAQLSLRDLHAWLQSLPPHFSEQEMLIAKPILDDLNERNGRLLEVGVSYLSMERASPTLSAGEAQRLRLAALLGSGLTGVLYVLDEPTIGLHPRDTQRLINVLRRLRDLGNTVLVVEHDLDLIRAADYLIDIGPGGGKHGGQIMAAGTPAQVAHTPASITGAYLDGRMSVPLPAHRRPPERHRSLSIHGARQFNLQNLDVRIPLGLLVAVTGVSGSGKSSLIFDILDRAARQQISGASEIPGTHDSISGWEHIDKVITIDQQHIGRIPRSNAATYSDTFTPIRAAFAATPEAKSRGITQRHFSFNVPGGRCERCEGAGTLSVKMHFLPEVEVRCPACRGRRFKRETLAVKYRGHDIAQVLELTVEEALSLFAEVPTAASRLQVMADVGLGYLQLGQPATTLSGGEAQRVKLAKELGRRGTGRTLYLLDEPTTGLHPADTARLLLVLQRLVEAGNSVVVVEHNLDLVKAADWVIDLGPEGGVGGGRLLTEGTPEDVAQVEESYTGRFLRGVMSTNF